MDVKEATGPFDICIGDVELTVFHRVDKKDLVVTVDDIVETFGLRYRDFKDNFLLNTEYGAHVLLRKNGDEFKTLRTEVIPLNMVLSVLDLLWERYDAFDDIEKETAANIALRSSHLVGAYQLIAKRVQDEILKI